jgi:hypothetical protein
MRLQIQTDIETWHLSTSTIGTGVVRSRRSVTQPQRERERERESVRYSRNENNRGRDSIPRAAGAATRRVRNIDILTENVVGKNTEKQTRRQMRKNGSLCLSKRKSTTRPRRRRRRTRLRPLIAATTATRHSTPADCDRAPRCRHARTISDSFVKRR